MHPSLETIRERILQAVPEADVEVIPNPGPSGQDSLLLSPGHALAVARLLRDDPELRLDYCSNVTGIDWPDTTVKEKVNVREGDEDVDSPSDRVKPGFLEVVYHLYSMSRKHGPVILRLRTADRDTQVDLPSLTPVWKSAEFQEREILDLYGVRFTGHPDPTRLLMWENFEGHPMRKDYSPPPEDDDETEPASGVGERDRHDCHRR